MSCFGCCGEDDMHKAADNGGQYMVKSSAGNLLTLLLKRMITINS